MTLRWLLGFIFVTLLPFEDQFQVALGYAKCLNFLVCNLKPVPLSVVYEGRSIELHDVVGWEVLWVEMAWFLFFLILNFGLWPRKRCNLFTVLFVGSNLLLQRPSTLEMIRKLGTRASSNFLFFSSRSQTDFLEI